MKPILHPTTKRAIDQTVLALPQGILLQGKRGTDVESAAEYIAAQSGTLLETVTPKKRSTSGSYVEDTVAGTIIIEDIRKLYERTRAKFTSPQIVIIHMADRPMSTGAQNAFLKLLEEPNEHIHFIIVTNDSGHLLPTVLSRLQRIDILAITDTQTAELLDEMGVSDQTERSRIQFVAAGLPAEIRKLVHDNDYYEMRVKMVQDARTILSGNSYTRLTTLYSYKDSRSKALMLIDDMIMQLKISLKNATHQEVLALQLDDLVDAYARISANGSILLNLSKVLL